MHRLCVCVCTFFLWFDFPSIRLPFNCSMCMWVWVGVCVGVCSIHQGHLRGISRVCECARDDTQQQNIFRKSISDVCAGTDGRTDGGVAWDIYARIPDAHRLYNQMVFGGCGGRSWGGGGGEMVGWLTQQLAIAGYVSIWLYAVIFFSLPFPG